MNIEWFLAFLPWLAIVACPVVMFWMMRGMHGGACDKAQAPARAVADSEVAQLRQRLARLEAQRTTATRTDTWRDG